MTNVTEQPENHGISTGTLIPQPHGGAIRNGGPNKGNPYGRRGFRGHLIDIIESGGIEVQRSDGTTIRLNRLERLYHKALRDAIEKDMDAKEVIDIAEKVASRIYGKPTEFQKGSQVNRNIDETAEVQRRIAELDRQAEERKSSQVLTQNENEHGNS